MSRKQIFEDIDKELEYANSKWGTEFDDKNTLNDWVAYIVMYSSEAARIVHQNDKVEQRRQLLKAAGLCISALESFDRNNGFALRHYDK